MVKRNIEKYINSQDFLTEHLSYDEKSGHLFWIKRPKGSQVKVGDRAGTVMSTKHGRAIVTARGVTLYQHHVAWFLFYGRWVEGEIDHINNNGLDNRIANLREATRLENTWNKRAYSKVGKGLKGAYRMKGDRRWFGQIVINGKQTYLGRFDTEEEAHAAYCESAKRHFGDFAKVA